MTANDIVSIIGVLILGTMVLYFDHKSRSLNKELHISDKD